MKRLLLIFGVALLAISCKKENSNEFIPYANHELNDTNWYSPVPQAARVRQLDSAFRIAPVEDSVDLAVGGVIHVDSVYITFPPAFAAPGTGVPTTGKVKVEVVLLKRKGDMVRANRPTMSYQQLLITGGALKIRVTYNGQEIQLAQTKKITVRIFTKMSNTSPTNDMRVFYGKEDAFPLTAVQQFTWIPSADTASGVNRASVVQDTAAGSTLKGYQFLSNRFGWINCDYFSDTTQPRTKAVVLLPANFTNANTSVFAVFKTPDIVAQLSGDPATKTFSINNIYVGKVVTFISLSYIDGKLYFSSREVTVTANMNIHLTPEPKTQAQIESFLGTL